MDARRDSHRLTVGEWRGAGRGVAVSVGIAGALRSKPKAPAVTAGASSLLGMLPVGLPRRSRRTAGGARSASHYSASLNLNVKVLDFVKPGGLF